MPFVNQAYLCANCDWIGEDSMRCAKCGSIHIFPLCIWIKPIVLSSKGKASDFQLCDYSPSRKPYLLRSDL